MPVTASSKFYTHFSIGWTSCYLFFLAVTWQRSRLDWQTNLLSSSSGWPPSLPALPWLLQRSGDSHSYSWEWLLSWSSSQELQLRLLNLCSERDREREVEREEWMEWGRISRPLYGISDHIISCQISFNSVLGTCTRNKITVIFIYGSLDPMCLSSVLGYLFSDFIFEVFFWQIFQLYRGGALYQCPQ